MEFFATQYLIAYAVESSTNFLCKQLSEYESNWFKLIEFDWFKVYLPATDRMHVVISLSQQNFSIIKNADQLPGIGYPPVQCVDFFIFLGYSKIMLL